HAFAANTRENGTLILNGSIQDPEEITDGLACRTVTFGVRGSEDYTAADISYDERACASFTWIGHGKTGGRIRLHVPGSHNIANALAAIAFAAEAGIDAETIRQGLESFGGTARRFEYKGNLGGITIVDDYAQ